MYRGAGAPKKSGHQLTLSVQLHSPYITSSIQSPAQSLSQKSQSTKLQDGGGPNSVIPAPLIKYYKSSEVDVRAEPIHLAPLNYPKGISSSHISGVVKLRVYINETGKIDDIQVEESSLGKSFEEAARQTILNSSFAPAIKDGINVKSQKLLEVTFEPIEETPHPPGSDSDPINTTAP
jgi:TonB family protein